MSIWLASEPSHAPGEVCGRGVGRLPAEGHERVEEPAGRGEAARDRGSGAGEPRIEPVGTSGGDGTGSP
jgi:hypothetical protein